MFKPSLAKTRNEYLDSVPESQKEMVTFFDSFIQKSVPSLKPYFANNMLGYGSFKYKNYKKEVIDWPTIGLASQKNYISLYICATKHGRYIAEIYKDKLGKVTVGKSCIRIKRIEDVILDVLKEVLKEAEQHPGLVLR